MPTINAATFTGRGWQEHYSGLPKDLFFATGGGDAWSALPHLHVNYQLGSNALASLTYKDAGGTNTSLFLNGTWNAGNVAHLMAGALKDEVTFIQGLA